MRQVSDTFGTISKYGPWQTAHARFPVIAACGGRRFVPCAPRSCLLSTTAAKAFAMALCHVNGLASECQSTAGSGSSGDHWRGRHRLLDCLSSCKARMARRRADGAQAADLRNHVACGRAPDHAARHGDTDAPGKIHPGSLSEA